MRRPAGQRISTHALREEGDPAAANVVFGRRYFYPRPPRGGRHNTLREILTVLKISTHALREEGDGPAPQFRPLPYPISTHALREEGDHFRAVDKTVKWISTHALREEGDSTRLVLKVRTLVFLPTPSARRATAAGHFYRRQKWQFLPTPSARRATAEIRRTLFTDQVLPTPSARRTTCVHGLAR